MKRLAGLAMVCAALLTGANAFADYVNITIDGDFSDWGTVPDLALDAADNVGSIDYATLQVANDENFFYLRYTLHVSINPNGTGSGTFLAIDEDNNVATGFDVFSLGLIGSEAGWQNDFPFEQATGNFNTGNGLSGATYAATPFNADTTSVELSIPRTATHTVGGADVFPADGQTIGVMIYNQEAAGDTIVGSYDFSAPPAIPEPSTSALFLLTAVVAIASRRRSRR